LKNWAPQSKLRKIFDATGKINGPEGPAEILKVNPNTLGRQMDKSGIPNGRKEKIKQFQDPYDD